MTSLTSSVWWKAAATRAFRTALVVMVPYIPATYIGDVPFITIGLVAALALVTSFITSAVTVLSETDDSPLQPWWFAVLSRVGKTVGQALLAGMGTAVLITDVQWDSLWQLAASAGFGSLILALITVLPEAAPPAVVTPTTNNVVITATSDAAASVVASEVLETLNTPTLSDPRV